MALLGKNLIISIGGTPIAAAKSCDIDVDCDTIEVSSVTSGAWRNYIAGRKGWSVSCGYLVTPQKFHYPLNVGTSVTLSARIVASGETRTFTGQYGGTVNLNRVTNPEGIYYHVTGHFFCARLGTTYYRYWSYTSSTAEEWFTNPNSNDLYVDDSTDKEYIWDGSALVELKALSGSAIVTRAKVTANVGNLVQGSFQFQGTGALSETNV